MKSLLKNTIFIIGLVLIQACEKKEFGLPIDGDGNEYDTIVIGTQIWLAENLKTTKYNNGVSIPLVTDNTQWTASTSAAFCWYDNDPRFKDKYGALYNWWAVNVPFLCPVGWHVPTNEEWSILIDHLSGEYVAGGKLKEAGVKNWLSPNEGATNETGFTALPGGRRYFGNGTFESLGTRGYWWTSSSTLDERFAHDVRMKNIDDNVEEGSFKKPTGYSVRCLKDNY